MKLSDCFAPAQILLPDANTPVETWGCIAVDQFTSQPEYWQKAEELAKGVPSTLHIVLPEAYLGTAEEAQRLQNIHATMGQYLDGVLGRKVQGFVYVERTQQDGTIRQGLVGAVDLECYSYQKGVALPIRPSENTVVERIPPRLAVRRDAALETPHVMMLADDPACTLIEPIGKAKARLQLLYEGELMLGGGHIAGWAVTEQADLAAIHAALAALGSREAFDAAYPEAAGNPTMTLAVGDGNHSLATAKAYWEELKATLPPEQWETHPARYCLAEVCNVQSPAIEIEPIHRVVFGATAAQLRTALGEYAAQNGITLGDGATGQSFVLAGQGARERIGLAGGVQPLTVGTVENFLGWYQGQHPAATVDYIHGEQAACRMAEKDTAAALILPGFEKADLFRGVVLGGVLPRKTFSMGHAEEKRYYMECRALTGRI